VHRDFKPSNTIVCDDPDGGSVHRVCVLDFGLAEVSRTVEVSDLHDEAAPIERSRLVLGTPAFMSPEQHAGREVDRRSDQYAFCVTLWQAVFGVLPFVHEGPIDLAALDRLGARKREGPPPFPDRPRLPRRIKAVLRRGLDPDPSRRFASMDALLAALAPVEHRRVRTAALVGLGLGALLAGGTALVRGLEDPCAPYAEALAQTWNDAKKGEILAAFAATGAPFADEASSAAAPVIDGWVERWQAQRVATCRGGEHDPTARLQLQCLQHGRDELDALLARFVAADLEVVQQAFGGASQLPDMHACADPSLLVRTAPALPPAAIADRVAELRAELARVRSLRFGARYQDALEQLGPLREQAEATGFAPLFAEVELSRAVMSLHLADRPGTERALTTTLTLVAREPHPMVEAIAWATLLHLRGVEQDGGAEVRWLVELARAHVEGVGAPVRLDAQLGNTVGLYEGLQGNYAAGMAELDRVIARARDEGAADMVPGLLAGRGQLHRRSGDPAAAVADFEESIATIERELGPEHPSLATPLVNLSNAYVDMAEDQRAIEQLQRAIAVLAGTWGPEHPNVGRIHTNLGGAWYSQRRYDEALRESELGLAIVEKALGPDHLACANAHNNVGLALLGLKRFDEALAHFDRALAIRRARGPDHPDVRRSLRNAGLALHGLGRDDEARARMQEAIATTERELGPHHADTIAERRELGQLELEVGRPREALVVLERAFADLAECKQPHDEGAKVRVALARALVAAGREPERARELALDARALIAPSLVREGDERRLDVRDRELLDSIDGLLASMSATSPPAAKPPRDRAQ
jgi:serine/threonine-protein kinase